MLILGVTGGLASGKSTVANFLHILGAPTVSADAIAHELLSPGSALTKTVLAEFPSARSQGNVDAVDRSVLSDIVFADAEARKRLEAITHPPIVARLQNVIGIWREEPGKAAVAEIPLLFEAGLRDLVDKVIVVACSRATQIERLRARLEISGDEASERIDSQWPLEKKVPLADYVVQSDISPIDTELQVRRLWEDM